MRGGGGGGEGLPRHPDQDHRGEQHVQPGVRQFARAAYVRSDGSVLVPGSVAGELLAAAVRDLAARAQRDGVLISDRARSVLYALHEASVAHDERATSASGSDVAASVTISSQITAAEAAALLECSPRWVRHVAVSGRITGRQVGRVWLLDRDSVDAYRRGDRAA